MCDSKKMNLPRQIKNIGIGRGMRDNFPNDEIDLKIKTAIAVHFCVLQKIFSDG
jgi:hypothetical protein